MSAGRMIFYTRIEPDEAQDIAYNAWIYLRIDWHAPQNPFRHKELGLLPILSTRLIVEVNSNLGQLAITYGGRRHEFRCWLSESISILCCQSLLPIELLQHPSAGFKVDETYKLDLVAFNKPGILTSNHDTDQMDKYGNP